MKSTFFQYSAIVPGLVIAVLLLLSLLRCVQAEGINTNFQAILTAADKGDAKAQYEVAGCYAQGTGVAPDLTNAVAYLRRSAGQGYADAEITLGSFIGKGLGVTKDPVEAFKWYRKAADQGNSLAQFALGGFYANGQGVPKDEAEAMKWWRKAADQGRVEAEDAVGQAFFQQGLTNGAAYAQAYDWLLKAAEHGYFGAMNNLGVCYEFGHGVELNYNQAAKWYRKAAENGIAKAQYNLGLLYLDGRGVPLDVAQAYALFKLSAAEGNGMGKKYVTDMEMKKGVLNTNQIADADKFLDEWQQKILRNKMAAASASAKQ